MVVRRFVLNPRDVRHRRRASPKGHDVMVWIHAINESAADEFAEGVMNPMSPAKLRMLARRMRLAPGHRVLDVGAGRCGPALILARDFGCHVTAVEPYAEFLDAARRRVAEDGLDDQFEFVQAQGREFAIEPARYDAAMCLGATWAWDGLDGTLKALATGVRDGGHVAAGEPYDSASPPHDLSVQQILECFESNGLPVVTLIRSSIDDWDTYESIQAMSLLDWLESNPSHLDADDVRGWRREAVEHLGAKRIGWAIVAGRKVASG